MDDIRIIIEPIDPIIEAGCVRANYDLMRKKLVDAYNERKVK